MADEEVDSGSVGFKHGDGFDPENEYADLVVILIDRTMVLEGRVGSIVDQLHKLSDSQAAVCMFQDRLVLCFAGYDDDRRWMCEVPEAVTFMRSVHQQWPFWFHFLKKDVEVFDPVLSMLLDVSVDRSGDEPIRYIESAANAAKSMRSMLMSVQSLYHANGLDAEDVRTTEMKVKAVADAWFRG